METTKDLKKEIKALIHILADEDIHVRKEARLLLIVKGKAAVIPLAGSLEHSRIYNIRWEAVKALDAIGDPQAIPALVKALNDPRSEIRWLAAEALKKFKKQAWPELMRMLILKESMNERLRHSVHHVLRDQGDEEFGPLLNELKKALESGSLPENVPIAAYNLLIKLRKRVQRAAGAKSTVNREH